MRTSFRFSLVASMTAALLSTSALSPSKGVAAVSVEDAGVSMTVKPGTEAAPALRMITRSDIQGERFTASAFEIVDLLLTDGTSLTMAAGTALDVDSYSYDPSTQEGDLAVNMIRGTLRVIGGTLNNTQPIIVTTPTATLSLDNATVVIVVGADGTTRAGLEYGKNLTVTSDDGETVEVMRPGFEVTIADDGAISGPTRRPPGASIDIARTLNPGLITGIAPETGLEDDGIEDIGNLDDDEQQVAQIEDDLTETEPEIEPFVFGGGGGETGGAGGFDSGTSIAAINLTDFQSPLSLLRVAVALLQQNFRTDEEGNVIETDGVAELRDPGLTTSVVFSGNEPFSQVPLDENSLDSGSVRSFTYRIFGQENSDLELTSDSVEATNFFRIGTAFQVDGEFVSSRVFRAVDPIVGTPSRNTIFGIDNDPESAQAPTFSAMLQDGFSIEALEDQATDLTEDIIQPEFLIRRQQDNFLVVESRPTLSFSEGRDLLIDEYELRLTNGDVAGASELLVRSFGLGVVPNEFRDFSFALSDADTITLGEGLAAALRSADPVESARSFLESVSLNDTQLTPEQRELALQQLTRQERFLFAAGDVDAALNNERRLDVFYLSPGLEGFDENGEIPEGANVAPSIRAFLRNASAFREEDGSGGIPLGDTGLMIIGTPANSVPGVDPDEQSGLLHADIGIAGEGADQQSTVSVTIGHVQYDAGATGEEVVLEGRTIASTQDGGVGASTLASGDLFNTSAGGGRLVDTDGDGEADTNIPGRATYFVIENFEPGTASSEQGVGDGETIESGVSSQGGGEERPIGGSPATDTNFAILRLATGKSSTALEPGEGGEFSGVSAGMLETEAGGGQVNITPITSDFTLELAPENNRIFVDGRTFDFGGTTGEDTKGESVYIDDDRFAARTNQDGSDLALVSGKVLQDAAASLPEGNATREFLDVPEYKHLKWGFFFGDTAPVAGADGEQLRQHIHLGSWIAGNLARPDRLPTSGTATYSGHAFGNVLNNQALYAARGTYENRWNFGSRAGLVTMDFDGANLVGLSRLRDGTVAFEGSLSGDGRNAGVAGVFVEGEAGESQPAGQFGTFQVRGDDYNAVGTFGGERE